MRKRSIHWLKNLVEIIIETCLESQVRITLNNLVQQKILTRIEVLSVAPKGKMLIRVRVAKAKLYGARVDVYEMQRRNDEREGMRLTLYQ